MLVEINLLPKKEPRNLANIIIFLIVMILIISGSIYFYLQISKTKQAIATLEQEINVTTEILTIEQKKLTDFQSMNAVEQLEKAIVWTEQQPADVNMMIQQLTKLLPTRGFMLDVNLTPEAVQCTIQFDSPSEAAYYLDLLHEVEWIEDAVLTESTAELLDEIAESERDETQVLPRYIADYQIEVNNEKIKATANEQTDQSSTDGGERP